MEAPEKIYVHVKGGKVLDTWNNEWIGVHDIEYIRTDDFIKKASEWIETNVEYYMKADKSCSIPMCPQFSKIDFIEKFKNAMKL